MTVHASVYGSDGVTDYEDVTAAAAADGPTWVHVDEADEAALERVTETFGLHSLAIENLEDEETRAKTEEYDTHTFVLLKTARLSEEEVTFQKEVRVRPLGLFIGPDWLVTVAPETDLVDATAPAWERRAETIAARGPDFIAYRVVEQVVEGYFALLDEVEDDIEAVEERVLEEPDAEVLETLNAVRRDLLAFRKIAWSARDAVSRLSRGDAHHVADANVRYFRDLYDDLVQVVDLIETYRDLTTGSRDIYLNTVSQSTNEVMKTLTVVATIFIPLTFVVGVYGMNFADAPLAMPELSWTYGYPAVMVGMALMALLMLGHFRRQGWL